MISSTSHDKILFAHWVIFFNKFLSISTPGYFFISLLIWVIFDWKSSFRSRLNFLFHRTVQKLRSVRSRNNSHSFVTFILDRFICFDFCFFAWNQTNMKIWKQKYNICMFYSIRRANQDKNIFSKLVLLEYFEY